jgi:hypothetical protein
MYAEASPRPTPPNAPPPRRGKRRRPKSGWQRLSRHTPMLETGARLAVNGFLTVAALGTLGRLVPYVHHQAQQLQAVNDQVAQMETSTADLRTNFSRYFDPAQAMRIMQEQTGYKVPSERQVVWTQDPPR